MRVPGKAPPSINDLLEGAIRCLRPEGLSRSPIAATTRSQARDTWHRTPMSSSPQDAGSAIPHDPAHPMHCQRIESVTGRSPRTYPGLPLAPLWT